MLAKTGICLSFLLLFCWTLNPLKAFDFWFYAEVGRSIVEDQTLPWSESYLGTSAKFAFNRYGDCVWLSCVLIYLVLHIAGPTGLVFLKSGLLITVAAIVYNICRHVGMQRSWSLVLVTLGLWTVRLKWALRTALFTDIALATLTLLFLKLEQRPRARLLAIGTLFIVWTNLHVGVLAGWIFVFMWLVFGRYPLKETASTLTVVFVAGHMRPHGFYLIPFWYDHFNNKYAFRSVGEWRPHELSQILVNQAPLLTLALAVLSAFLYQNRKKLSQVPWHYVVIVLAFGYLSLRTKRGVGQLLPVVTPMVAALRPTWKVPKGSLWVASALLLLAIFKTTHFQEYRRLDKVYPTYPVYLVDELDPSQGQVYNSYEFGGYLVYRGFRPFIHGLTALYREGLFEVSNSIVLLEERRYQLMEEYDISQVLLHFPLANDPLLGLINSLHKSEDWKLVSFDDSGLLFKKTASEELSNLTPWARPGWRDPGLAETQLATLTRRRPSTIAFVMQSELFRSQKRWKLALHSAQEALALNPYSLPAYLEVAYSATQLRDAGTLKEAATEGLKLSPDSALMTYFLALSLYLESQGSENNESIRKLLQRALKLDPTLQQANQLLDLLEGAR